MLKDMWFSLPVVRGRREVVLYDALLDVLTLFLVIFIPIRNWMREDDPDPSVSARE